MSSLPSLSCWTSQRPGLPSTQASLAFPDLTVSLSLLLCFRSSPLQPPGMHLLKHLICTSWGPLLHPVMAAKGLCRNQEGGSTESRV